MSGVLTPQGLCLSEEVGTSGYCDQDMFETSKSAMRDKQYNESQTILLADYDSVDVHQRPIRGCERVDAAQN